MGTNTWKKVSVGRSVILRPIKTFFVFFLSFFLLRENHPFILANFVQNGIAPSLHLRPCLRHDAGRQRWSNWRFPRETVRSFTIRRSEDMPVELQNDAGRVQRSLQEAMQRGMRSSFPPQLSPRDVHQYIFLLPFTSVYKPNALQRQLLEGDLEPTIR